jgi:hypothetical protein
MKTKNKNTKANENLSTGEVYAIVILVGNKLGLNPSCINIAEYYLKTKKMLYPSLTIAFESEARNMIEIINEKNLVQQTIILAKPYLNS